MLVGHIAVERDKILEKLKSCLGNHYVLIDDLLKMITDYADAYIDTSTCLFRVAVSKGKPRLCIRMFRITEDDDPSTWADYVQTVSQPTSLQENNHCRSHAFSRPVEISLPLHVRYYYSLTCFDQKIFTVCSGYSERGSAIIYYDLVTRNWKIAEHINFDMTSNLVVYQGVIYFFKMNIYDYDNTDCRQFGMYSPLSLECENKIVDLPLSPNSHQYGLLTGHNGKIYTIGGTDTWKCDCFDIATNSWGSTTLVDRTLVSIPLSTASGSVMAVVEDDLYVMGANNEYVLASTNVIKCDLKTGTWSRASWALPSPRAMFNAHVLSFRGRNKILVFGGKNEQHEADDSYLLINL